jgi:ABC-type spermidine/putrescine transport system permease subunit II
VNSVIIGPVVAISVPVGLAAAIMMGQIYHRARGLFYLVTVSPVLTPGVIIGISTVIFWKDMMGLTDFTKAYFYKGIILSIFGQSSLSPPIACSSSWRGSSALTVPRKRQPLTSEPASRKFSGIFCYRF